MAEFDDSLFEDKKYVEPAEFDDSLFEDELVDAPSMAESALRGGAQGVSFGFADELTGALEAAGKTAFGSDRLQDILENYKKYRDESRAAYKAAEEANPYAYLAGELGGGVVSGLGTGGAGVVGGIGKTAAKQLMIQGAKVGAAQGAAQGLGMSEAEDLGELTKDVGIGTLGGGVLGGVAPVAIEGLIKPTVKGVGSLASKGAKALSESSDKLLDIAPKPIKLAKEAFQMSKKGKSFIGEKAAEEINQESLNKAQELVDYFKTKYKGGSSKVSQAMDEANLGPQDITSTLKEAEDLITSTKMIPDDRKRIQGIIDDYKKVVESQKVVKTGKEIAEEDIRKQMLLASEDAADLGRTLEFSGEPVFKPETNRFKAIGQEITDQGESVPKVMSSKVGDDLVENIQNIEYDKLDVQGLYDLRDQIKDLRYGNTDLSKGAKDALGNFEKLIDTRMKDLIETSGKTDLFKEGMKEMSDVRSAGDLFSQLKLQNMDESDIPGFADILTTSELKSRGDAKYNKLQLLKKYVDDSAKEILGETEELTRRKALNRAMKDEGSILGSINPLAVRAGAGAGKVSNWVSKASPTQLQSVSQRLMSNSSPEVQEFGRRMQVAMSNPENQNKLMWALSQQPAFRQAMGEYAADILGADLSNEQE